MKNFTEIFASLTAPLKFGPTATGLDLLGTSSITDAIIEHLFYSDCIPATQADLTQAFNRVTGRAASEAELIDAEAALLNLGFLAR